MSPDRPPSARHWAIRLIPLVGAFTLLGVSACIIGPKQDDPETAASTDVTDTGTGTSAEDTSRANPSDTSASPFDEAGGLTDVGTMPGGDTGASDTGGGKTTCTDAGDAGDAGDADGGCSSDGGGSDALSDG